MMKEITFKMSDADIARLRVALRIVRNDFQDSVDFVNKHPELSSPSDITLVYDEDLRTIDLLNNLIDLLLDSQCEPRLPF